MIKTLNPYSTTDKIRYMPIALKPKVSKNVMNESSEENDMLKQFQGAPFFGSIMAPQQIWPLASNTSVGCIIENPNLTLTMQVLKKSEEVEFETLPTVVSVLNNKTTLTNSTYNEMIGQPKCPWLDFILLIKCSIFFISSCVHGG
ncbi:hypothetical protein V6N12_059242 [Hibiscus sabdariffa]|uniref:Uncharacterized protein n=1 Tax=Hibiscus sabdariffa TaxID=183260 RepID=A0ABR2EUL1_9ROSI